MPPKRSKLSKTQKYIVYGLGVVVLIAVCYFGFTALSPQADGDGTSTPASESTFSFISYQDGEDVSWVEMSMWLPKSTAKFDEVEDIYTMSNYEEEISSRDAEDVSIDLSDVLFAFVQIDPDGETVFSESWILLSGGVNYAYSIYVYHLTSDVNFNILTRDAMDEITVGDYSTDSNLTVIMDCPHYSTSNIHVGTNWAMESDDFDELSASEKAKYYDEKNWRCQAPLYDPNDDLEKEADDDLECLTEAFAIELDFNASVSTTNGATTQINLTLADSKEPIEIVFSGDKIYLIFYETIDFEAGDYTFDLEIEFGSEIHLDNAKTGRIAVPRGDDNLGAFTAYSAIAA